MIGNLHTFGNKPFLAINETTYKSHDGFVLKGDFSYFENIEVLSPSGKVLFSENYKVPELLKYLKFDLFTDIESYEIAMTDWVLVNDNVPRMTYNFKRDRWEATDGSYVDRAQGSLYQFDYSLYSDTGEVIQKSYIPFSEGYAWEDRSNSSWPNSKINSGHLTKGTVFKTKGLGGRWRGDENATIHAVKHLEVNSPGHYIVVTETMVPDILDSSKLVNDRFSIRHVSEIMKRSSEEVVVNSDYWSQDFQESDVYDTFYDIAYKQVIPVLNGLDLKGRDLDMEKLRKRLTQMGLVTGAHYGNVIKDLKKVRKFVKKNPHWAFHTVSFSKRAKRFEDKLTYNGM